MKQSPIISAIRHNAIVKGAWSFIPNRRLYVDSHKEVRDAGATSEKLDRQDWFVVFDETIHNMRTELHKRTLLDGSVNIFLNPILFTAILAPNPYWKKAELFDGLYHSSFMFSAHEDDAISMDYVLVVIGSIEYALRSGAYGILNLYDVPERIQKMYHNSYYEVTLDY